MSRLNCSPDLEIHKLSFGFAFKVIPGLLFFSKLHSVILAALMRANIGWPNEGKRISRGAHGCILVAAMKLNCSLDTEVQKLSFDLFPFICDENALLLQKNVCTVFLCFGHVGAMTTARDHGVLFGHVGS